MCQVQLDRSRVGRHCTAAVTGVLRQICTVEADQHSHLRPEGNLEPRQ